MEDMNAPEIVNLMTDMADKQLEAIMDEFEERKEAAVPAIAPKAQKKR